MSFLGAVISDLTSARASMFVSVHVSASTSRSTSASCFSPTNPPKSTILSISTNNLSSMLSLSKTSNLVRYATS